MESGVLYVRNLANTDWVVAVGGIGAQGYQGNQGPSGSPGTPGGPQGYQGVTGAVGPSGSRGTQGYQGSQGYQGNQGYQGHTGRGYQGYQGETGSIGPQGYQGFLGYQGYQGVSGSPGSQGYQGASGSPGTPGGPQGYQGDQGVPGTGSGGGGHTIQDEGTPLTQRVNLNFAGENVWAVDDAGNNATKVIISGGGATGPQGYQGATGATGPQGYQGHTGVGFQGYQGATGAQGFQGYQGHTGVGAQGYQGATGAQGAQGYQGTTGVGVQGYQGATGSTGPQGYQGATGSQGTQGTQGFQGYQGYQGHTGMGFQGYQGYQGATGTSSGGGHVIQDEGSPLAQRTNLNFIGNNIWAVDNPGNDATDVIISGTATSPTVISGSPNYLAKFNATGNDINNSIVYQNSSNLGVGTTSPQAKLDVISGSFRTQEIEWNATLYSGSAAPIVNSTIPIFVAPISSEQRYHKILSVHPTWSYRRFGAHGELTYGYGDGGLLSKFNMFLSVIAGSTPTGVSVEFGIDENNDAWTSWGNNNPVRLFLYKEDDVGDGCPTISLYAFHGSNNNTAGTLNVLSTSNHDVNIYQGGLDCGTGTPAGTQVVPNMYKKEYGYVTIRDSLGIRTNHPDAVLTVAGNAKVTGSVNIGGYLLFSNPNAASDVIYFGPDFDVNLYRGTSGQLRTDDRMRGQPAVSSTEFMTLGQYTGSQGPQGYQGATGSPGAQGYQGATGSQGFQGYQGYTGSQGPQGYQGETGSQGFQGYQGYTGSQGPQGYQGATGSQGSALNITGTPLRLAKFGEGGNSLTPSSVYETGSSVWFRNASVYIGTGTARLTLYDTNSLKIEGPTIYLSTGTTSILFQGDSALISFVDATLSRVSTGTLYINNNLTANLVIRANDKFNLGGSRYLYPTGSSTIGTNSNLSLEPAYNLYLQGNTAKIYFGTGSDVNLYRAGANQLKTDDTLILGGGYLYINTDTAYLYFGALNDVNLYRSAADRLKTDNDFIVDKALNLSSSTLTISSGTVTVTKSHHYLNGEGSAADDLVTINGGIAGDILMLQGNGSYAITIKHAIGNVYCGGDKVINGLASVLTLRYDGSNWVMVAWSG